MALTPDKEKRLISQLIPSSGEARHEDLLKALSLLVLVRLRGGAGQEL